MPNSSSACSFSISDLPPVSSFSSFARALSLTALFFAALSFSYISSTSRWAAIASSFAALNLAIFLVRSFSFFMFLSSLVNGFLTPESSSSSSSSEDSFLLDVDFFESDSSFLSDFLDALPSSSPSSLSFPELGALSDFLEPSSFLPFDSFLSPSAFFLLFSESAFPSSSSSRLSASV